MPDTNWTLISGSTPQDYIDTAVFEVNPDTKQIALITGQALVAGEKDSQYISFLMPRYWDGIDISDKTFTVEYALAGTYYGTSEAVNAEMTTEQVRFGWVVPETACAISGTLLFVLKVTSEDYILKTQIAEHPVFKTIRVEDVVPEPTKEAWYIEFQTRVDSAISEAETAVETAQATLTQVEASVGLAQTAAQEAQTAEDNAEAAAAAAQIRYGSPLTAAEADQMIDENRVYVYTGSESGYTAGNWYYYDGSAWVSGGVYNGSGINTDTTLTQSGMPADAKATGDEISQIKEDFTDIVNSAYVTDSASGSVAHFVDGADGVPMKSVKVNIEPVQSGTGDPSPTNVRPISGWNAVNVTRVEVNLWDEQWEIGSYDAGSSTVQKYTDTTHIRSKNPISVKPNTTYYFMSASKNVHLIVADVNGNVLYRSVSLSNGTFTTPSNGTLVYFNMAAAYGTTYNNDISINYPSTDHAYHPYNGVTVTVQLGQTVYGGKLDVLSGVLTVYPYYASYNGETLTGRWISDRDVYAVGTTPTIGAQVVNIGAEGTEIQLEPHEVNSLLGTNNIFADTGDVSCEYRADTTLYIQRLTEPDADMIADSNITSGQYFMVGNNLYKATANIASGGQVIVGTNAIRKSLSEALNEINS